MAESIGILSAAIAVAALMIQLISGLLLRGRWHVRLTTRGAPAGERNAENTVTFSGPIGAEKTRIAENWVSRLAAASIEYIGNSPRAK